MLQTFNKRAFITRFVLLYVVTLILLVVVFSAFATRGPAERPIEPDRITATAPPRVASIAASNNSVELEKLQAELGARATTIATLTEELKVSRSSKAGQQDSRLQAQLATQTGRANSLEKQLAATRAAGDNGKELARLRKQVADQSVQIRTMAKASGNKNLPRDADQSTIRELETRNANLVTGFKSVQTQVGMLQKNYNALRAENVRLKEQLANLRN